MAFTTRATGDIVQAVDITDIHDALTGTSGQGVAFSFTQANDSANYALVVRQLDLTNGYIFRAQDGSSNTLFSVIGPTSNEAGSVTIARKLVMTGLPSFTTAANMLDIAATWNAAGQAFEGIKVAITNTASAAASYLLDLKAGAAGATNVFLVTPAGLVFIEDNANANMTIGLTINQGGNSDEVLAFKSSNVDHGMIGYAETDTYGLFKKTNSGSGGLHIIGLDDAATSAAFWVEAFVGAAADTTHSAAGFGVIRLTAGVKSGANVVAVATNSNLLSIDNFGTTVAIIDAEGDIHLDAGGSYGGNVISVNTVLGYNTYDEFDDPALVRALEVERQGRGLIEHEFDKFLQYNRDDLQRLKLATFNDDGHHFVNYTALVRLHSGAIWQIDRKLAKLYIEVADRLRLMEQRVALLPDGTCPAG